MNGSIAKCPICGKIGKIINSNNPIVPGACLTCLNEQIDYNNLKQANFFCRTYNLPWLPDRWLEIAKDAKFDTFYYYTEVISNEYSNTLYTGDATDDKWEAMNKEWQKCLTHQQLLDKIAPIKADFITRMQIKWGTQYDFQQLIALENLFTNTLQSSGVTNPLTIDIIKKVAIVSVNMERCLNDGDVKGAAEYSKMHKSLIDAAGLSDMVDVGETEVIGTVAELCDYIESKDFQLKFYDGCTRDVVDKTIRDQQEWTRNFVLNSTGIQQTYEIIENTFKNKMEREAADDAYNETSLEELIEATKAGMNKEFDDELDGEVFDLSGDDADELEY